MSRLSNCRPARSDFAGQSGDQGTLAIVRGGNRHEQKLFAFGTIKKVKPSARGCEECLKMGSPWVHLRICRTCGHVGCCDSSPNRHAAAHFHETGHPVIEGYDPPEGWGWCYRDEVFIDLGTDTTPQDGPIPRFY